MDQRSRLTIAGSVQRSRASPQNPPLVGGSIGLTLTGRCEVTYKEYEESVADFVEGTGCEIFSTSPNYEEGCVEPHFSWSACQCCGSLLGGDRYDMVACNPGSDPTLIEFRACSDCLFYLTYDQLDDMTMMNVEDDPDYQIN